MNTLLFKRGYKKTFYKFISCLLILSFLPINIIKVFAASNLIGITPISRASGISVDAYAIEEMMIENLTTRSVTQYNLEDVVYTLIEDGNADVFASTALIDDIIRAYGIPVNRDFVTSSFVLQNTIIESIDNNLPVVLISYGHQVIVDGYRDISGFEIHVLNPDPGDTEEKWRVLSGINLTNPSMAVQEIITVPDSINIKTEAYGTIDYDILSRNFSGGSPPSSEMLREAIRSAIPYVNIDEMVSILDFGDASDELGVYALIIPEDSEYSGDRMTLFASASYWLTEEQLSQLTSYSILPIDSNGYLDHSNLNRRIRNLNLLYRAEASFTFRPMFMMTEEDQEILDSNFNRYWWYHKTFSKTGHYENVLKEILAADNHLAYEANQNSAIIYAAYQEAIEDSLKALGLADKTHLTWEIIKAVEDVKVYDFAVTYMKTHGQPVELAEHVLGAHRLTVNAMWQAKILNRIGGGLAIAEIGYGIVGKYLAASQPVRLLKETQDELVLIRDHLEETGQEPEIKEALDDIIDQMEGEVTTFWEIYIEWWESGEVWTDLGPIAIECAADKLAEIIAESHPIVMIFYLSAKVGFVLGDALTNNSGVDLVLRDVVVAKDIMAALYDSTYTPIRNSINTKKQGSVDIPLDDIELWDAVNHLTLLTNTYSFSRSVDMFNVTTDFMNWLFKQDGRTYKEIAEQDYLPSAKQLANYTKTWVDSATTSALVGYTEETLWDKNVGTVISTITSLDGVSPPKYQQQIDGVVNVEFLVNGTDGPFDVTIKIDGSILYEDTLNSGAYSFNWNTSLWHDGVERYLKLSVEDSNGVVVSDIVRVVVGDTSNVRPEITLDGPISAEKAFRYYTIHWNDYDPDDDAKITLGYDSDNNGCDGTVIQNWISEDWVTDWWTWRDIPNESGATYWIYAIIEDSHHDPVCEYSPSYLTIDTPTLGNGYSVDHFVYDDEDNGDGDGIWESEEQTDIEVYIKNETSYDLNDVYGVISVDEDMILINDEDDTFWAAQPGVVRSGKFTLSVPPGFVGPVNIQLDIYYRENNGPLKKDTEIINLNVVPAGSEPSFVINTDNIQYDDSDITEADNDGIPESGEDDIYTDIMISNIGGATATNVEAVITTQPPEIPGLWRNDPDYPDIAPGESEYAEGIPFRIDDIPANFSGPLTQTLTVYYGVDREFSQDIEFTIDIQPTPRIRVEDNLYNFGLVSPGTLVSHDFTVQNIGTQTATISSVTTSDTDLTFPNFPTSIPAGETRIFTAQFDTTGLDASVVRTFTISSNAHLLSRNTGTLSVTVTNVDPSSLDLINTFNLDSADEVVTGDTDGDGKIEIIVSQFVYSDTDPHKQVIHMYEWTAPDTFTKVWDSSSMHMNPRSGFDEVGLAIGDVTGDGKDDIVYASGYGQDTPANKLHLFTSNGNNSLALVWSTTLDSRAVAIGMQIMMALMMLL